MSEPIALPDGTFAPTPEELAAERETVEAVVHQKIADSEETRREMQDRQGDPPDPLACATAVAEFQDRRANVVEIPAARVSARRRKPVRATMSELLDVLAADDPLSGLVRLDEMRGRLVISAPRPWGNAPSLYWTDADTTNLRAYIERRYKLIASKEHASDAVHVHALRNRYHPLRDWLNSLVWDGVKRLDGWLIHYCAADDTEYVREVGRRFLISAVARVLSPGCKADCMLLMEGPQGCGKSMTARTLASDDFYSDAMPNMDDSRHVGETVAGVWILELSELAGLRKHEVEIVKQFLSRREDTFRAAYAREALVVPRQFVCIGTVNPDGEGTYLRDETGGRRFWPVAVSTCDINALAAARAQLFAEAVAAYRAGESHWIESADMRATAAAEAQARTVKNPWLGHVADYLMSHPGIAEVRTCDVFVAKTARASTYRDSTDLRFIAGALREFGFTQHEKAKLIVWRRQTGGGGP
ncbi:virulence-associated E family protein [Paraburkholderia sp. J11-2]|uniref:virulence-associated E family protein n=1 Tax=Paraburkholderia sp. J11-2 TaxID=2805431 RepID=UPI002AB7A57A|nr:virulence-associated E family protein [Paraburkholderia sp. J11-2]